MTDGFDTRKDFHFTTQDTGNLGVLTLEDTLRSASLPLRKNILVSDIVAERDYTAISYDHQPRKFLDHYNTRQRIRYRGVVCIMAE